MHVVGLTGELEQRLEMRVKMKRGVARERLPPAAAGDEWKALGFNRDAGSLHMFLDVPKETKIKFLSVLRLMMARGETFP